METNGCMPRVLTCENFMYYGTNKLVIRDTWRLLWGESRSTRTTCLQGSDSFSFGAYKWTVQLVTNESRLEKILFPIFWGLMTLRY